MRSRELAILGTLAAGIAMSGGCGGTTGISDTTGGTGGQSSGSAVDASRTASSGGSTPELSGSGGSRAAPPATGAATQVLPSTGGATTTSPATASGAATAQGSGGNTGTPSGGVASTGGQTVGPSFPSQRKELGCDGLQEYVSRDGKSCYMIDPQELPWADARAVCKAWGGDLVAFDRPNESTAVSGNFGPSAWTGGRYNGVQWVWPDGTEITNFIWDTSPTQVRNDGECLVVRFNELWDDLPCTLARHPLCEKPFGAGLPGGGGAPSAGGGAGVGGVAP